MFQAVSMPNHLQTTSRLLGRRKYLRSGVKRRNRRVRTSPTGFGAFGQLLGGSKYLLIGVGLEGPSTF